MTRIAVHALCLSLTLSSVVACSDDDPAEEPTPDATPAPTPDATEPTTPDAASPVGCDPISLLPNNWRPIDKVSTGTVTTTPTGQIYRAVIDATAGGLPNAADNPYTYVNLITGQRVDITDVQALTSTVTDVQALTSTDWHIAFKRSNIRVNGGDSGKAGLSVATVEAAALADVTAAPAAEQFGVDDWSSDACAFVGSEIQEPTTRMGTWYDYSETGRPTPKAVVYVMKTPGPYVKVEVLGYTDPANASRSAVYTIEWTTL
jgi:hypothetical protein